MARRRRRKTDEIENTVVETENTESEIEFDESVPVEELEEFDDYTADYDQEPIEEISNVADSINEYPQLEEVVDIPVEEVLQEEAVEELPKTEKKDLNQFFEKDKKKVEKLKKKKEKPPKEKKKSKRQLQKERDYQAIKDKRVFKYKGKKYSKVEDFVKYVNDHYLDIEQIANEVLEDENFLGWISKKSGTFSESIKKFKEIKQEIENN